MFKFKNGEALPCPFCGGSEIWAEDYDIEPGKRWRVFCARCMAGVDRGHDVAPYAVLEVWNKRVNGGKKEEQQ
ncbi:MAG: Lar family restriction alleviation protein [Oscillospiraceae bacterium]